MKKFLYRLIIVFLLYYMVAYVRYSLKYPEKTQTQLFLEIPKALLWK